MLQIDLLDAQCQQLMVPPADTGRTLHQRAEPQFRALDQPLRVIKLRGKNGFATERSRNEPVVVPVVPADIALYRQ